MLKEIVYRVKEISKLYVEVHVADIHFGVLKPEVQFNILKEQFLYNLESMEVLDIVSINGDLLDHKFMANSDVIMYACYFIEALVDICRRKGSTLIIVGGTLDHDADQLKLFYHYIGVDRGVDVRIVEEVRFEYIKGKRVLIIPELYNKGASYYNKFLLHSGLYDAVYMHGTFKGTIYGKDVPDLDSDREPVFQMEDFVNCKGPIISGHNHTPGCHSTHFHYCGTPIRYKFGQEEDKGFMVLLHNIESREYYVHFEPITSFRYDTINLDGMIDGDPKEIIAYVKNMQANGIHNIRLKLSKNNEDNLNIIRSYFRSSNNVKIDANFKNEQVIENMKKLDDKYKEHQYLFDKGSIPEDKLSKYINHCKGYTYITTQGLIDFLKSL